MGATAVERHAANKWAVLAVVGLGMFMSSLDLAIVNVAIPTISSYFGVPLGPAVEWVVLAYLIAAAALMLTFGRLADLLGRKPIWAAGLAIFALASALCGAAPSLGVLIAARAVQGMGCALLWAVSFAILIAAFPAEQRGRATGLLALIVAIGVSSGPVLGGVIVGRLSWRWIFYVNIPVAAAGLVASSRVIPYEPRGKAPGGFDPIGALLLAVAMGGLTCCLSFGNGLGWRSPSLLFLASASALATVLFLRHARRHPHPIVDLSLFGNRVFSSATMSLVLCFIAVASVTFLLPFYLVQARHFDPEQTGMVLTALPLTMIVIAPIAGWLADAVGTRWLTAAGMALLCTGLLLLSRLDMNTSRAGIIWRLVLTGLGQGLFYTPNNSAILGAAPPNRRGLATGMLSTCRVVGQSLSIALCGAVFAHFGGGVAGRALARTVSDPDVTALQTTFLTSFRLALWACASAAAVGVATSLARGREGAVAPGEPGYSARVQR